MYCAASQLLQRELQLQLPRSGQLQLPRWLLYHFSIEASSKKLSTLKKQVIKRL
jgi:hypothetical protein